MSTPTSTTLTIGILTIPQRINLFNRLMKILQPQLDKYHFPEVELIVNNDVKKTIGKKRQEILDNSIGTFIVYIDDDDTIEDNYLDEIIKATKENKDCITFKSKRYQNNQLLGECYYVMDLHSVEPLKSNEFSRWPMHVTPIKTNIAKQVGFNDTNYSEDALYSMGCKKLIKTETHIDKFLYNYYYLSITNRVEYLFNAAYPPNERK